MYTKLYNFLYTKQILKYIESVNIMSQSILKIKIILLMIMYI